MLVVEELVGNGKHKSKKVHIISANVRKDSGESTTGAKEHGSAHVALEK